MTVADVVSGHIGSTNDKPKLSYDQLRLIVDSIETVDNQLDKLHWQACSFMDRNSKGDVIKNIREYRHKLGKAKDTLYRVYEAQYAKTTESEK